MIQSQKIDIIWLYDEGQPLLKQLGRSSTILLAINGQKVRANLRELELISSSYFNPFFPNRCKGKLTIDVDPGILVEVSSHGIRIGQHCILGVVENTEHEVQLAATLRLDVFDWRVYQWDKWIALRMRTFPSQEQLEYRKHLESEALAHCHYYHGQYHGDRPSRQFIRCFNHPGAKTCDGCPDFRGKPQAEGGIE